MASLTMVERLFLEDIETRAGEIQRRLEANTDDLNDFACNTMEEDKDRITKDMRNLTDEILLKDLPRLCDDIQYFREHRKHRNL